MIFRNGPSKVLFMLLIIAALFLIALDLNSPKFREGRSYVNLIITPLQWLVDMPARLADNVSDVVVSRSSLVVELTTGRGVLLEQRVLQNAALTAENRRLRALLNARSRIDSQVRLAELIGVDPNPFQHEILTNLGSQDGITIGQPALDSGGVMGQGISVAPLISRVMLITDSRAAVPGWWMRFRIIYGIPSMSSQSTPECARVNFWACIGKISTWIRKQICASRPYSINPSKIN